MVSNSLVGYNKQISLLLQGLFLHSGGCLWERTQGELRPPQLDGGRGDGWRGLLSELHARGQHHLYLLFSALEQKILFSVINENILESWLENQSTERGGKLRGLCWRVCSSGHPPPGPIEHSQYNSVRSQSTTKVSGSIKVIQLELTNGTRSFCEIKYDYFLRS